MLRQPAPAPAPGYLSSGSLGTHTEIKLLVAALVLITCTCILLKAPVFRCRDAGGAVGQHVVQCGVSTLVEKREERGDKRE